MKDELESQRCARLLKAMADPERLRIVQCLRAGEKNVSDLAAELGVEVVNLSHHLGVLRHAGIVVDQRQGRFIFYRLHPTVFEQRSASASADYLEFGCCRLEIPKHPSH
jgi:ArsR family transcriptional regulator